MGVIPSPAFHLRDIALANQRYVNAFADFMGWPGANSASVYFENQPFSWAQNPGTGALEMVNTDEGGYMRLGPSGGASSVTQDIRCLARPGTYGQVIFGGTANELSALNPRLIGRLQFAAAQAALDAQVFGFMVGGGTFANIPAGAQANAAAICSSTTGNLFFRTSDLATNLQSTDLGAAPAQVDKWEVRTDNAGVSWQCYKNDVLLVSHSTRVPTLGVAGLAIIGLKRTVGTNFLALDLAVAGTSR